MPEKPVISNTSPLVGLWTLNLFPFLRELYTEVLIPAEVRDEFFAIETEVREAALKSAPWIRTVRLRNLENIATHAEVDLGEAAVFVLAQERDARLVILDDWDARQYAGQIGLPFTGTVGLLLEAKESGFIDAVAPLFFGESLTMKFNERTMQAVNNLITCNTRIMSGTPVFKNTRVPIKNLIDYLEAGDSLNEFLEDFPSVSRTQAMQALELAKEMLITQAYACSD